MSNEGYRSLRAYKHYHQVASFLMAGYIRVQNHLDTSRDDPEMVRRVEKLSQKCYNRFLAKTLVSVATIKRLWNAKDVRGVSSECKRLHALNIVGARLSALFESPIVSNRKDPKHYTELEDQHMVKCRACDGKGCDDCDEGMVPELVSCKECRHNQNPNRECKKCKGTGRMPWEFEPKDFPPVDVERLSHDMSSFREALADFYEDLK